MKKICAVAAAFLAATGLSAQVMCWNIENFFDTYDDPLTADEPFTPRGDYRWTRRKFTAKRNLIAKTIIASAECFGGELPCIVGLCEVENRYVLDNLLQQTPLAKCGYRALHREGRDPRGIDVALLYDARRVRLLHSRFITIEQFATRDILYAEVVMGRRAGAGSGAGGAGNTGAGGVSCADGGDTLHIFLNHWPSKYGGVRESAPKRQAVSDALAGALDSLFAVSGDAAVLIMGDFNDTPDSPAVWGLCSRYGLTNLTAHLQGSIKFRGVWEMIDQVLVSPAALPVTGPARLYSPDFLLEEDKTYLGRKPRRTNIGPRYNGGASDHLPLLVSLEFRV